MARLLGISRAAKPLTTGIQNLYAGLSFGVKSLNIRLPAGIVPTERYLADTTAKLSQWLNSIESTRSLVSGISVQTTCPTDPDGLRDKLEVGGI